MLGTPRDQYPSGCLDEGGNGLSGIGQPASDWQNGFKENQHVLRE